MKEGITMLNIYEYPTCTTCKKAKKLLTELIKGIDENKVQELRG